MHCWHGRPAAIALPTSIKAEGKRARSQFAATTSSAHQLSQPGRLQGSRGEPAAYPRPVYYFKPGLGTPHFAEENTVLVTSPNGWNQDQPFPSAKLESAFRITSRPSRPIRASARSPNDVSAPSRSPRLPRWTFQAIGFRNAARNAG